MGNLSVFPIYYVLLLVWTETGTFFRNGKMGEIFLRNLSLRLSGTADNRFPVRRQYESVLQYAAGSSCRLYFGSGSLSYR